MAPPTGPGGHSRSHSGVIGAPVRPPTSTVSQQSKSWSSVQQYSKNRHLHHCPSHPHDQLLIHSPSSLTWRVYCAWVISELYIVIALTYTGIFLHEFRFGVAVDSLQRVSLHRRLSCPMAAEASANARIVTHRRMMIRMVGHRLTSRRA